MPDIRHSLQNLADALSPNTGTSDGFVDNVETSLARISQALPKKLGGKIEAESLADEYDDQATYGIGDYCTHDGVFYICATAIAIAESWNSAKWVAVPIIEILQEKLNAPADGAVAGRYLMVGQNGEPVWGQLDESDIRQSVYDWLSAHPEAIVVNDGTITRAKLDDSVGQAVDEVSELKADFSQLDAVVFPNEDVLVGQAEGVQSTANRYWSLAGGAPLVNGNTYRIALTFSDIPAGITAIRTATGTSGSTTVDSILSNFDGESWTDGKVCIYTPTVDGVKNLQIQFNSSYSANLTVTLKVYDYTAESTPITEDLQRQIDDNAQGIDGLKYNVILNDDYNLLPPDGYTVGKIISTDGIILDSTNGVLSDFIEIDPNQGYICNYAKTASVVSGNSALTGNLNTFIRYKFCFFDADKKVVSFTGDDSAPSKAIPENAKYIRVCVASETLYPYARLIYGNFQTQPIVRIVDYQKRPQKSYDMSNTGMEGFKMVMFGDSITHGSLSVSNNGTSYVNFANDYLHSNIVNVGFGGTRMTYTLSGAGLFCFYHLCECIVSDDPTVWDDLIAYATDTTPDYMPHLQALMNMDWSTVKAVGLMYGANDYTSNTPVGASYNETLTNYDGACAYGLKLLLTKYPHLQVLILAPFDRERTVGDPDTMTDRAQNTAGLTMTDYADSLENVVSRFHCPLVRTDKLWGINQYNILTYAPDGTHPRANIAQKRLGWLFARAVINNLAPFNG